MTTFPRLPVRFWQAVPTGDPVGHVTDIFDLDPSRTAFVSLHCWNVGCPGGPPVPQEYWVDMGSPRNHVVAWQIICDEIVPALAAARRAGLPVMHVQTTIIGDKYPHLQPPMPDKVPLASPRRPPISDHASVRANRVHGKGFSDWEGWQRLDFAEPTRPLAGETVVVSTDQWDDHLRARGIDTLIYAGFATNLCILDAPGGMRLMCQLGYRCVILREATLAVEFPDTLESRRQTEATLRHIEGWVGYTASRADFTSACEAVGTPA